jgi:divalent metal cation (Fe/Co/Zn/Cd) transporter
LIELALALLSGSVALLGDALHNLSDVSTSVLVFIGFRASKWLPTDRYPYGFDRAEDLAGVGIAVLIWASAAFAGVESVRKLKVTAALTTSAGRSPEPSSGSSATRLWPASSCGSALGSTPDDDRRRQAFVARSRHLRPSIPP